MLVWIWTQGLQCDKQLTGETDGSIFTWTGLFFFFFFSQGKGCGLIFGTPWLLSVCVTAGMLFKSNFFYLKVFMWADKTLSLYPKVHCSTLVLQITLTFTGAATLWTGNQFSPSFSAWSFMVDNGDVCVMLLTDLRMQPIKRLKGISPSDCMNLFSIIIIFFCWNFIYLRWGGEKSTTVQIFCICRFSLTWSPSLKARSSSLPFLFINIKLIQAKLLI